MKCHLGVRLMPASYLALLGLGIGAFGFAESATARVTHIDITTTGAAFPGESFGSVGPYQRIEGTITGEIDPADPQNAVIVDIALAPKNPNGTVGYKADFQILRPGDLSKGNHRVNFELPNRGRTNVLGLFNDSGTGNAKGSSGASGNTFLMSRGYTIVEGGWDTSAQGNGSLFTVQVPTAKDRNGSTITGPATEEFVIDKTATASSEPLTYPAATPDKSKASLTVREHYADKPIPLGAGDWNYTDATLTAVKLTAGNFPGIDDGILTQLPLDVDTPYQAYVPKTDQDGNDIAGVRTPDIAVPLATYTGWALRAEADRQDADGCASGQRLPFAATKAARLAAGDPRLSLQERYKDHPAYVGLVAAAARHLEAERLLLEEDVQAYIAAAEAAAVP